MKKLTLLLVFCFLMAAILPELTRAQQPPSLSFAVFEEKVSTSDMTAFNKVQQETVDLWNKLKLDIPISCYSTDDNSYFWVLPVKSFASLDTIFAKSAVFMKKAREQEGFTGNQFRDLSTNNFSYIS